MGLEHKDAYKAIILFGLVSLMGDIIYEGARGITPTYLELLGASAIIVGTVFSIGEFISIALRIVSGILTDIYRSYWIFFFLGYGLIISIPFIGFTNIWWIVAALVITERFAKSLRSPARDTLLSMASKGVGAGKAFGLHELLDQTGAVLGPLGMGLILLWTGNKFNIAYTTLFIPYIILIVFIILVYRVLRVRTQAIIREVRRVTISKTFSELPLSFKLYGIAVALNTMGLIHWSLILYQAGNYLIPSYIAFLYVFIQLVDAISAPVSGHLYDKYGLKILLIPFMLSLIPSILTLYTNLLYIILAGAFFGVIYGMQESIYRAAVSDIVKIDFRGTAYGVFNTFYGIGLLLSGIIFGYLLSMNYQLYGSIYTVLMEVLAVIVLFKSLASMRGL